MAENTTITSLPNTVVKIGVGWQLVDESVKIELLCYIYDTIGNLIDVVFSKDVSSSSNAIVHSGDGLLRITRKSLSESMASLDQTQITFHLPHVHKDIALIIIALQCKEVDFADVKQMYYRIVGTGESNLLYQEIPPRSCHSIVLCAMNRDPKEPAKWSSKPLHVLSSQKGINELGNELDAALPIFLSKEILAQRPASNPNKADLNRGEEILLPSSIQVELMADKETDSWCYMYSGDWFLVDEVGFSRSKSNCGSVKMSKVFSLELGNIPPTVKFLFFVTKLSGNLNVQQLKQTHVRVVEFNQKEVCKYKLTQVNGNGNAVIFCKIYRFANQWRFMGVGEGVSKNNVSEPKLLKKFVGRPRKVNIIVKEGRNLCAKDSSGTSDPYVVLNLNGVEHKSPIIKKNLNPQWNFTVQGTTWSPSTIPLHIVIWDWDRFSKDDFMGEVKDEEFPVGSEKWITLQTRIKKENVVHKVSGDIRVIVQ